MNGRAVAGKSDSGWASPVSDLNYHPCDWELVVRVKLKNVMEHDEPEAERAVRELIADEGGLWQTLASWTDPEDFELVSIRPAVTSSEVRK
jgi:hypothetical protein